MTKVLIVEDDVRLLRALRINLKARGYEVDTAVDGAGAAAAAARDVPDVMILDLGLPDMDGIQVIDALRAWASAPVIVLSGRADVADKIAALDGGAHDYLTKPFSMEELLARIRVAERYRYAVPGTAAAVRVIGRHTVDLAARTVRSADGTVVDLTPTEWRILEVLVVQPHVLIPSMDLIRAVWGPRHGSDTSALRFHVTRLRRKLESDPARPAHLLTEAGMGYRFRP